jgi:hypothetical protein
MVRLSQWPLPLPGGAKRMPVSWFVVMTRSTCHMSISIDGLIAGPDQQALTANAID